MRKRRSLFDQFRRRTDTGIEHDTNFGPFRAKTGGPLDRYALDKVLVKSGNKMI
jgi:hypothetical protein